MKSEKEQELDEIKMLFCHRNSSHGHCQESILILSSVSATHLFHLCLLSKFQIKCKDMNVLP